MFWNSHEKDAYPGYPLLPPPLRCGAILTVEPGEILRFADLDLAVALPGGELITDAVSSLEALGLRIARAYAREGDEDVMFQFNQQADGTILDINFFRLIQPIYPQSPEDWDIWLGDNGLIGGPDVNAPNGRAYTRDWGDGLHAQPVEVTENVFNNKTAPPIAVKHKMMLYSRELAQDREYLLLSADEENGQALVRAWAGVSINAQALKVY